MSLSEPHLEGWRITRDEPGRLMLRPGLAAARSTIGVGGGVLAISIVAWVLQFQQPTLHIPIWLVTLFIWLSPLWQYVELSRRGGEKDEVTIVVRGVLLAIVQRHAVDAVRLTLTGEPRPLSVGRGASTGIVAGQRWTLEVAGPDSLCFVLADQFAAAGPPPVAVAELVGKIEALFGVPVIGKPAGSSAGAPMGDPATPTVNREGGR